VHPIRAELVEIDGTISGQIIATRKVVIHTSGRLTGAVSALGFSVDKGGYFLGELSIGKMEMTPGGKVDWCFSVIVLVLVLELVLDVFYAAGAQPVDFYQLGFSRSQSADRWMRLSKIEDEDEFEDEDD
jgi:hypothetical protein